MRRLGYHLRLAARDLRRNATLSWAIFAGLAIATAIWTNASCHVLRVHDTFPDLAPSLHQVEIHHRRSLHHEQDHARDEAGGVAAQTQVSHPEWRVLAASGIPSRQASSLRARVLVTPGPEQAPRSVAARFTSADLFEMFGLAAGAGRTFTRAEESGGQAVLVLGKRLAGELFPEGEAVGRTLLVDGRAFRVLGVLAAEQPLRPAWDPSIGGAQQDGVYLPLPWWQRLLARPEQLIEQSPVGERFEDLVASDALFISFWVDLPSAAQRRDYTAYLAEHLGGPGRPPYRLRDYPTWRRDFAASLTDVSFLAGLTGLVLLGAGFNAARLLLAKGFARGEEIGIYRALGASRRSVFARQMLEAALMVLPAALLGVLLAIPYADLFNRLVDNVQVRVEVTAKGFWLGLVPALAVGLAAAIYPAWRLSRTGPAVRLARR